MNTNFIYYASYHDALRAIIAKINARHVDLGVRHLLIVPERYTLLAEKYLYENTCGSFDIEVLSLSRLFYKMRIETPLLSREGAIMLIRGMLPSLELKCYYRSVTFRGFCEKLYDAINDFAANGIEPEDIPDSSLKLSDLKTVYAEYKRRITGRFVDSMGKLSLIARDASASEYLNNVHIYVANFDYVDKATRNALDALNNRALSYTECVISGDEEIKGKKEKYFGEGALAVKEAAKRIRYHAYNGVPYEDMAVIMGNASTAQVKRIFEEFEIPCFLAENKRLSDFSLSAFLMALFECAERKSRESFIVLSKNIYTGVEKRDADEFENYVNSCLIDYKGFYEEFSDCEPEVEQVRKKLISIIDRVEKKMKGVYEAESFGKVIEDIFEAVSAQKITEEAYGSDAATDKIRALIALMEQVSIKGSFDFMAAVFAEGLKATKMSSIPYEGGVIVGDPASFRGGKYKFLAVLGFDDGFLPQIYDDSSLIGDDEKEFFSQMERAEAINNRYERELSAVLASSENIFATYSSASGMMDDLFGNAPEADEEDNYILRAGCKKHAVELMLELTKLAEVSAGDERAFINALFKATNSDDSIFLSPRVDVIDNAEKLFFPLGKTSVSQLQRYFKCPYRHFADYGLRLKDRDKGEISAVDIGSFLHMIVEKIVRSENFTDIEHSVREIVDEFVAKGGKFALPGNKSELEALKNEAVKTIGIYVSHLKKGKFKPLGQEIEFEYDLGGIKLAGKIDMADEYDGYIRLIDYKTGDYELKYSDVYYGMSIQLPMYMAACGKKYKQAAMFNFPFVYNWLCDKFDHRFSGFMLSDDEIVDAIDGSFTEESEVFSMKRKEGDLCGSDYLLSKNEMQILTDYAVRLSKNAIKEIKEGYAAASPCGEKECKYCSYACLCEGKTVRKKAKMRKSGFYRGCNDENLV